MTAEIAIMNKSAVALAADSAVTIQHGKGYKIYNTLKLFNLCQSNPVGVMVYENADFMSVPWETIIKHYRKQLGNTPFDTLEEYGANFIAYLNNPLLFPESVQDQTALSTVYNYLKELSQRIDFKIKELTIKGLKVSEAQIKRVLREMIKNWHDTLKAQNLLPPLPASIEQDVRSKYGNEFDKFIDDIFQALPLTEQLKKSLRSISTWLLTNDLSNLTLEQSYSGVVIAGFGETDLYPAVITYRVETVVLGHLRYIHNTDKSDRITTNRLATVVPFAQDEMVYGFMEGIDPKFHEHILNELLGIFKLYPEEIVKRLPGLTKKRKDTLLIELKKVGVDLVKVFNDKIDNHKKKKHIIPIVRAVSVLPKEELASMAEALVNLTSTKRRVTLDAETVGGPIDVAVISKGDGFIWIKRKHYFDADKNPQFLSQYKR
ncbi:MAG: hypothetical protein WCF57_04335 [Pyrinomonadaceae bacterium]